MQESIVVNHIHLWRKRNNRDLGIHMDWSCPQHPVPLTNDFLCNIWHATIHTSFFHTLSVYQIFLEHVLHNKPRYSYNLLYSILRLCNFKQLHVYKECLGAPWLTNKRYYVYVYYADILYFWVGIFITKMRGKLAGCL